MSQTKRDIQGLLAGAGISPLKRFGQNFLIDGNLMKKMAQAGELCAEDVVLEVGPGTGGLTDYLVALAGHVVAVEIDRGLAGLVGERFSDRENFTLIHSDVLERKHAIAPKVLETLKIKQLELGGRVLLIANLPYQVATPLIIDLLLSDVGVSRLCFTVQAEVADRMLALPNTRAYGPLSIVMQVLTSIERIAKLSPNVFWPPPKVDSSMVRMDVITPAPLSIDQRDRMVRIVRHAFNHRRKTMRHALKTLADDKLFQSIENNADWDLTQRPEQWPVAQWMKLAMAY